MQIAFHFIIMDTVFPSVSFFLLFCIIILLIIFIIFCVCECVHSHSSTSIRVVSMKTKQWGRIYLHSILEYFFFLASCTSELSVFWSIDCNNQSLCCVSYIVSVLICVHCLAFIFTLHFLTALSSSIVISFTHLAFISILQFMCVILIFPFANGFSNAYVYRLLE